MLQNARKLVIINLYHSFLNNTYFLQDTVPPIGFAIICRQHHMVRFLLDVEDYDKSIYGVRIVIALSW